MIIVDLGDNYTADARGTMAKRRNMRDSFGKRVRDEREERQLTQADMIRLLRERYGIEMSEAAFSKIEIGETKRLHLDLQMAIAGLLQVDIRYLLTGEEPGTTTTWSEEAEQIAGMVDQMSHDTRQMMLAATRATLKLENDLLEAHREIARLLEENISLLSNGDRMIADAYIDRIGHRSVRR